MNYAVAASLVLSSAACDPGTRVLTARDINAIDASYIKEGTQTEQQIRAYFGDPISEARLQPTPPKACVKQWMYMNYVREGHSRILLVRFDAHGVVCDKDYAAK
jgi:hypothetical protein